MIASLERRTHESSVQKRDHHAGYVELRDLEHRGTTEERQSTIGCITVNYERRVDVGNTQKPVLRKLILK
jgi:hypothetical protein